MNHGHAPNRVRGEERFGTRGGQRGFSMPDPSRVFQTIRKDLRGRRRKNADPLNRKVLASQCVRKGDR